MDALPHLLYSQNSKKKKLHAYAEEELGEKWLLVQCVYDKIYYLYIIHIKMG